MAEPIIDLKDFPKKWGHYLVDKWKEPIGFVRIRRYHPVHDVWVEVLPWDKNLIVNSGRDSMSDQISGAISGTLWTTLAEAQTFSVSRALVGDGGHGNPGPVDPFPPALGDTDLGNFVYELPFDAIIRPSAISVGFQFTIPAVGPNDPFSEFGLGTTGDGTNPTWSPPPTDSTHKLVARKTFGLITKIPGWEYSISWIIIF
jgi:hypothetical protein